MTAQREFQSGDRGRFAFKLAFHPDPDEAASATPEESSSWGSFEIWAGGQNLCTHTEQNEEISAVHWYMLPLLEWLVSNWDLLLHESRLPVRNAAVDAWDSMADTASPLWLEPAEEDRCREEWKSWWNKHCVLAARRGGLFPNVFIRRWQDLVEVSWGPARLAGQPSHYRFLASKGYRRLRPEEVSGALFDVIQEAVGFLYKSQPASGRIRKLEQSFAQISQTPKSRRLAILSELGESRWTQLEIDLKKKAPAEALGSIFGGDANNVVVTSAGVAALMFGSASPTVTKPDIELLADQLVRLFTTNAEPNALQGLVRSEPLENSDARPWNQGYTLADDVLAMLSFLKGDETWVDIESICNLLGIEVRDISLEDRNLRAVAVASPHTVPAILLNIRHPTSEFPSGRRFSMAHELCHLLFDRSYGARVAVASGTWAPRDIERRANSFAAELLMPAFMIDRIRAKLNIPLEGVEGIARVAQEMKTSFTATLEHLKNLGFLSEIDRDRIREMINVPAKSPP